MVVVTFSGCEKLELYEIDAPQDLQSKIDSIAAAREGRNTGDTTYIDIIKSIEVTQNPLITTYCFFSNDSIILDTRGLVVTATYGDDSQGVMPLGNLSIGKVPPFAGTHNITITYKGETSTVSTTLPITMVKGSDQVGATDFSTGFAGDVSVNIAIPYGESLTYKLKLYSLAGENWHNAIVRLQKSDGTLTTFARMDHWAWGDGYIDGTTVVESNWNWDTFKAGLHGSSIEITTLASMPAWSGETLTLALPHMGQLISRYWTL